MARFKKLHAILMITGTSVGTGILGLPITTSIAGFFPTVFAFIVAWLFMTIAALYILDIKMQFKGQNNLSSLIQLTLGRFGQYLSSTMIIILLYALLCTYMMAGSAWFSLLFQTKLALPPSWITVIFVLIFGLMMLLKERIIYPMNNFLGICLGISLMMTVGLSLWPVNLALIQHSHLPAILPAMPLLLTTFGFSIVVPAVTEYLDYDARATKTVIIIGSLIAFVVYLIWEWVILGHVPLTGPLGLKALHRFGDNGTGVIRSFAATAHHPWAIFSGQLFAIFAAITSFLGVSLALSHCLEDLLPLQSHHPKQLLLTLITILPPLIVTLLYPKAFIQILSFAGLGVALLLGIFPTLMMAKTRYTQSLAKKKYPRKKEPLYRSYPIICLTGLFFTLVVIQEIINLMR